MNKRFPSLPMAGWTDATTSQQMAACCPLGKTMQLRLLPLTFALTLAGLLSIPAIARSENSASADLLRSAHMWEAKDRPDLARVMLEITDYRIQSRSTIYAGKH
jgi:hypothetical protein